MATGSRLKCSASAFMGWPPIFLPLRPTTPRPGAPNRFLSALLMNSVGILSTKPTSETISLFNVEISRVTKLKGLHQSTQKDFPHLNEQVIGQKRVCVKRKTITIFIFLKELQIEFLFAIITKYLLAPIASCNNVIKGARKMNAWFSCHACKLALSWSGVNTYLIMPDPITSSTPGFAGLFRMVVSELQVVP